MSVFYLLAGIGDLVRLLPVYRGGVGGGGGGVGWVNILVPTQTLDIDQKWAVFQFWIDILPFLQHHLL